MESLKYVLFSVLVIALQYVENAPTNDKQNSSEDELRTRLVFVDNDNNVINSNSRITAGSATPILSTLQQKTSPTRSKQITEPVTEPVAVGSSFSTKMDDERQNWGLVVEETELTEEDSYYNRPLSIPKTINTKVLEPKKASRAQPKVLKTEASNVGPKPSACDIAIIMCCGIPSDLSKCFKSQNCFDITDDMLPNICNKTSVNKTVESIAKYYKGILTN